MRDEREHGFRPAREEVFRREGEGATRVGHVVDEDRDFVLHVPDEHHARDLVGLFSLFVEEGEIEVERGGHGGGAGALGESAWIPAVGEGQSREMRKAKEER